MIKLREELRKKSTGKGLPRTLETRGESGNKRRRHWSSDTERGNRLTRAVLVLCAVIAVLVALDHWANAGKIHRGVSVGDVKLGGKTPKEARSILEERATGELGEIRLTGRGEELSLSAEEIGMKVDVSATVDRAYAMGRRGSVLERLGNRMGATLGTARVPLAADYQRELVQTKVENLAGRMNTEPQEASVDVRGEMVEVIEAQNGYRLNVPATLKNLDRAAQDLSGEATIAGENLEPRVSTPAASSAAEKARRALSGSVTLSAGEQEWTLSPTEIGQSLDFAPGEDGVRVSLDREVLRTSLTDLYADLSVESVEASFTVNGEEVSVEPSREGKAIAEDELFEEMESGILRGRHEYEVPVRTITPELTTAEAEKLKPTELLGSYRTNYTISGDSSAERVENLGIASGAIDGTALAPGEVFSFNELAAPLAYNEAKVIVDGEVAYEDGGGLCQVSSTLYMAANKAGLDVIERHPHYAELPYIRPGFDATVWFGSLDMKFKNTTDGYVLMREMVGEDGYVYAEIWGRPIGREVEMSSKRVSALADSTGWITYQTVKEDGKVLFDGVLHEDTYQPLTSENGEPVPNAAPAPPNP